MEAEAAPPSALSSSRTLPSASGGVSNCYVFKSRLQEYTQKVGITTPVYETNKEGPSHEPVFQSSVVVNGVKYYSLPGFYNRKAAEQSAAEIALMELHKSGSTAESFPTLTETGLCKNLLQEYAQKMNYAIPSYICSKQPSGVTPFTCTVEIGGIHYIGGAARTKKEAEIKAARTALLAIRSVETTMNVSSEYTVVPGIKKGKEPETQSEAQKHIKPKKANFKRKWSKKKPSCKKGNHEASQDDPGRAEGDVEMSEDQELDAPIPVLFVNEQIPGSLSGELRFQDLERSSPDMNENLQCTLREETSIKVYTICAKTMEVHIAGQNIGE